MIDEVIHGSNEPLPGENVKVTIVLNDGTRMMEALVFIPNSQRLSDVMNDSRKFLPLQQLRNVDYVNTVIHKDAIMRIEEER